MNRRELLKVASVLLGGTLSASLARGVLGESIAPAGELIAEAPLKKISVLCEMIIPKTDTPGAIDAGVPSFVAMMVSRWYTDAERRIFFAGLDDLDTYCVGHYAAAFLQCDAAQRIDALTSAENAAKNYRGSSFAFDGKSVDPNTPFFTKLKELAVLGYCMSETGSKQFLAYNPMPMRFDGDYEFAKVGTEWAW